MPKKVNKEPTGTALAGDLEQERIASILYWHDS
jgi:hypothetical protein